jgi:bifunctional DNA-binding transcriptional regulator/antitoxin component of YhaV-PrlF toxin-antitoxin module
VGVLLIDKLSKAEQGASVLAKITSKRQVTFPAVVLDAMGVGPGDRLEIVASPAGFLLRPRKVDHARLAPLRECLKQGAGPFNLQSFRKEVHEPSLRD